VKRERNLESGKRKKNSRSKITLEKIFDGSSDIKWFFDQTLNSVYIHDFEGNFLYANQKALQLLGVEEKDITRMNFRSFLDEGELPKAFKFTKEILEYGSHKELAEYKLKRSDGKNLYVICEGFLIYKDGKPSAILGTAVDITDRKEMEEELKASEEKYRAVVEQSLENIYIMDMKNKKILEVNPAFRNLLGYSAAEMKNLKPYAFIAHSQADIDRQISEVEKKGRIFVGERQYKCKDGHIVDVEVNASVINYMGEKAMCVVSRDITDRKKAEEVLRESESLFRSLFENNIIGIYRTTPEGRIIMANPALVKMMGFPSFEELAERDLERNSFEIGYPRQDFKDQIEEKGQVIGMESAWKKKDGSVLFIRESARVIRDKEGKTLFYEGTIEDITERKKDEELIKASLREKDVLLREIHHRVKNNLQIITSLLRLQSSRIKEDEIQDMFKTAQNRIRTMALIHEKLYQSQDLSKIDISQYIRNLTIHLLNIYRTDPKKVDLDIEIGDVYLDINTAIPCGLIINELVSNSLKYAFPGKRRGMIRIELDKDKRGTHILKVSDNGVGLPEDLNMEATDTLGLQLVNDLTKQIQGKLTLTRKPGTVFEIVF